LRIDVRRAPADLPAHRPELGVLDHLPPIGHPEGTRTVGPVRSTIEIVLPTGMIVRAPSGFDPRTLGDVLAVLEGRPC
jgi:hypothetical protein